MQEATDLALGGAINAAITDTLGRTIITSGTTLVAVLALYLFGGTALSGFASTVLAGIFVGTWSSVFVAAPIAAVARRRAAATRQEPARILRLVG